MYATTSMDGGKRADSATAAAAAADNIGDEQQRYAASVAQHADTPLSGAEAFERDRRLWLSPPSRSAPRGSAGAQSPQRRQEQSSAAADSHSPSSTAQCDADALHVGGDAGDEADGATRRARQARRCSHHRCRSHYCRHYRGRSRRRRWWQRLLRRLSRDSTRSANDDHDDDHDHYHDDAGGDDIGVGRGAPAPESRQLRREAAGWNGDGHLTDRSSAAGVADAARTSASASATASTVSLSVPSGAGRRDAGDAFGALRIDARETPPTRQWRMGGDGQASETCARCDAARRGRRRGSDERGNDEEEEEAEEANADFQCYASNDDQTAPRRPPAVHSGDRIEGGAKRDTRGTATTTTTAVSAATAAARRADKPRDNERRARHRAFEARRARRKLYRTLYDADFYRRSTCTLGAPVPLAVLVRTLQEVWEDRDADDDHWLAW